MAFANSLARSVMSPLVIALHYVHKKVRIGPDVATFLTKALNFS